MRQFFLTIMFLFVAKTFFAQKADSIPFRKNLIYGELGGNLGLVSSLNYERKLFDNNSGFFTARIGIGVNMNGFGNVIWGPALMMNYISGKHKNHFEIGFGARLPAFIAYDKRKYQYSSGWGDNDIMVLVPTANLMYRYQKPGGKLIFRIGWTPLFYNAESSNASPAAIFFWFMCGASIGYAF